MTCGIYMIKNKNTGQMYIGQSINIERRWREHCRGDGKGKSYIDDAMLKYGEDSFELIILSVLEEDKNILNKMEEHYIKIFNTYKDKKHYNLTSGGDANPLTNPDIRKKFSESMKGKNNPFYGKKHTDKSKKLMSKAQKKRVRPKGKDNPLYGRKRPEHSKKIRGKNHPNYGRKGKDNPLYGRKRPEHSKKMSKYTLWNTNCCHYKKQSMFQNNRKPNPCSCFYFRYNTHDIAIGGFIDFLSPQIIFDLIP